MSSLSDEQADSQGDTGALVISCGSLSGTYLDKWSAAVLLIWREKSWERRADVRSTPPLGLSKYINKVTVL